MGVPEAASVRAFVCLTMPPSLLFMQGILLLFNVYTCVYICVYTSALILRMRAYQGAMGPREGGCGRHRCALR